MENMGYKIKDIIKRNGIKQKDLAEKINMAKSTLNEIINSDKEPGVYKIFAIAKHLEVSVEYLLVGEEKKIEQRTDYKSPHMSNIIELSMNLHQSERKKVLKILESLYESE